MKEQEKKEKALRKETLEKERAEKAEAPEDANSAKPEKKKRKPPNGPMTEAMDKFVTARRANGVGYIRAMKEWGQSAEREAIVSQMSESERKRRRYDLVEKKAAISPGEASTPNAAE